ncbi:MAG: histidine--tRNA ligase [Kiritimatiellia bacterium]
MTEPSENILSAPRGMRDFYPEEMAVRNAIFAAWAGAARQSGFVQYDSCVVENLALLKRKGGEEIAEQLYTFQDKSGRDLALRAEMTPTLARMVAARQNQLPLPLKWFAIAQCFRYERMSRGRKREHYQWNLDIIGEESVSAEAEVVATAVRAMARLGLGPADAQVRVNSRALLGDLLARSGIEPAHHAAVFLALDKRGKIDDNAIADILRLEGLNPAAIDAAFRILALESFEQVQAALGEPTPASIELAQFFALAADHGIRDSVLFDISIIRGLGYYTGIVFECFDTARQFRAIFGGGRYNNLLGILGGKPMGAVGIGFGDVVVAEVLAEKGRLPSGHEEGLLHIGYMDESQRGTAIRLAAALRAQGRCVNLGLSREKPKAFFARAGKSGVGEAAYIGPDDVARGNVRVKNMADRSEREMPLLP